jgi:hypothetical protein
MQMQMGKRKPMKKSKIRWSKGWRMKVKMQFDIRFVRSFSFIYLQSRNGYEMVVRPKYSAFKHCCTKSVLSIIE